MYLRKKYKKIKSLKRHKIKRKKIYEAKVLLNKRIIIFKLILKLIIILFFIYSRLLLKEFFYKKKKEEIDGNFEIYKSKKIYKEFQSLENISYDAISEKYRNTIFKAFSKYAEKEVTSIDNVFFNEPYKFGNMIMALNKIVFFCEIIKCKKILLDRNNSIYIKNNIYDEKYNLTIEVIKSKSNISADDYMSLYLPNPYYKLVEVKPENRFYLFKNEILKNLPFIKTEPNDMYIYLRSGDIFIEPEKGIFYAQPPLCFYKTIINNNKFNNIYLISENSLNPNINALIKLYPNIIFQEEPLELDIAKLIYGYNIVGSISSFISGIIKLNDNLRKYWEYDNYQLKERIFHFHHSIYNFKRNYTIYQMSPSKNYLKEMAIWKGSRKQIKLMLRDKCPKKFKLIEPNS